MSNRRKIASIAFTGAAAATVTMMGAAPTFAAGTLHIKNGAKASTGTWHAHLKTGTMAVQMDVTRNTALMCKKGVASGGASWSPQIVPAKFGTMGTEMFSSCFGPFGLTFKEHLTKPASLMISTAIRSSHGSVIHTTGRMIGAINYKISGTGLAAGCKATISGTSIPWAATPASFIINSGRQVTLRVKSATGCLGAIAAGDRIFMAAVYSS